MIINWGADIEFFATLKIVYFKNSLRKSQVYYFIGLDFIIITKPPWRGGEVQQGSTPHNCHKHLCKKRIKIWVFGFLKLFRDSIFTTSYEDLTSISLFL